MVRCSSLKQLIEEARGLFSIETGLFYVQRFIDIPYLCSVLAGLELLEKWLSFCCIWEILLLKCIEIEID